MAKLSCHIPRNASMWTVRKLNCLTFDVYFTKEEGGARSMMQGVCLATALLGTVWQDTLRVKK